MRPITLQNTKAAFDAFFIPELGVVHLVVRQNVAPFLGKMIAANEVVAKALKTEFFAI